MKNKQLFCLLLVVLMTMLAACSPCEHQWEAANCKDPKTCRLCGDTTGVKNDDHQWEDATTDAPKTCSVCGLTEGDKIIITGGITNGESGNTNLIKVEYI